MTGNNWIERVRAAATNELSDVGAAAGDLAKHGQRAPSKPGLSFQTVAEVVLLGTAVIGAAVDAVHLSKALGHRQHDHHPGAKADAAGSGRSSHRKRGQQTTPCDSNESNRNRHATTASRGP